MGKERRLPWEVYGSSDIICLPAYLRIQS